MTLSVTVSGGLGGHSGTDVARGRSNAIKVLGRVLREALAVAPFSLVAIDGGRNRNAIPRDATATCSLAPEHETAFRAAIENAAETTRDAYTKTDPGVTVVASRTANAADAWTEDATAELLDLVAVAPNGPLAISPDFEGLVETSTSIGEVVSDGTTMTLHHLSRSSNPSAVPEVLAALEAAAHLAQGRFAVGQADPGRRPNLESAALAASQRVYERLFGQAPIVTAVHAWLETAAIADRVAGIDMVSFGPQIEAAHSPDERVQISTVERFWRLLTGVVDDLSATPSHIGHT